MTSHARDGAFQTSDGSTIAFTVHPAPHPDAPRLALIHSLALDRSVWDGVVGIIAGETELLTYDCRGHGRSDRRATAFTAELFARDLGRTAPSCRLAERRGRRLLDGRMRRDGIRGDLP